MVPVATAKLEIKDEAARQHRIKSRRAANLQQDAEEIRQMTLGMEARLAALRGEMEDLGIWFERIDTITNEKTRSPNVRISNLTPSGDKFTLSGMAVTLDDAVQYAANIRSSGLFVDVSIVQVESGDTPLIVESPLSDMLSSFFGASAGIGEGVVGPKVSGEELDPSALRVQFIIEATAKPPPEEQGEGSLK